MLTEQQQLILLAVVIFFVGCLVSILFVRAYYKKRANEKDQEIQQNILAGQQQLTQLDTEKDKLNRQLIDEQKAILVLKGKVEHLASIEPLFASSQAENKILSDENIQLKTEQQQKEQNHKEQLDILTKAKVELSDRFKSLAQEILDDKSKIFTQKNEEKLGDILNPLKDQINGFRKRVDEVYDKSNTERASLKQELVQLQKLNTRLSDEASNLTKALKGDKKAQGIWGELILEKVLEESGLRLGHEYETQGAYRDEDNNLYKPDFIIHLPEEKDVVVDSKVSLIAYEQFVSTQDEQFLKDHVMATRNHIDGLSKKDYSGLKGIRSLDYVLMFMPIEPAFIEAVQYDPKLFDYAFKKKIVLVTPTTLLAILKTIESIWRYEKQNNSAQKIADSAAAVYNKLTGFVEDMEKIGKQLDTVNGSYDKAMSKLTTGRGNLISLATNFTELGVKVKKNLPKHIVEDSGALLDSQESLESDSD